MALTIQWRHERKMSHYTNMENNETINLENYFICLEHHDDFLFAFSDNNGGLKKVDTYQAKNLEMTGK